VTTKNKGLKCIATRLLKKSKVLACRLKAENRKFALAKKQFQNVSFKFTFFD